MDALQARVKELEKAQSEQDVSPAVHAHHTLVPRCFTASLSPPLPSPLLVLQGWVQFVITQNIGLQEQVNTLTTTNFQLQARLNDALGDAARVLKKGKVAPRTESDAEVAVRALR